MSESHERDERMGEFYQKTQWGPISINHLAKQFHFNTLIEFYSNPGISAVNLMRGYFVQPPTTLYKSSLLIKRIGFQLAFLCFCCPFLKQSQRWDRKHQPSSPLIFDFFNELKFFSYIRKSQKHSILKNSQFDEKLTIFFLNQQLFHA